MNVEAASTSQQANVHSSSRMSEEPSDKGSIPKGSQMDDHSNHSQQKQLEETEEDIGQQESDEGLDESPSKAHKKTMQLSKHYEHDLMKVKSIL